MRTTGDDNKHWQSMTQQYYLPFTNAYNIPVEQTPHFSLSDKKAGETSQAYPCSGMTCHKTIKTEAELEAYLQNNSYRILE
jgi:hypothetical protein